MKLLLLFDFFRELDISGEKFSIRILSSILTVSTSPKTDGANLRS